MLAAHGLVEFLLAYEEGQNNITLNPALAGNPEPVNVYLLLLQLNIELCGRFFIEVVILIPDGCMARGEKRYSFGKQENINGAQFNT